MLSSVQDPHQIRGLVFHGPWGVSQLCVCASGSPAARRSLLEQSQLFLFKQSRGIEDLRNIHWLSPDLTCLLWGLAPKGDFQEWRSPQLLLSYDLYHFSLKLSTYS